ncbi:hypothetical protein EI42_04377 [Thermosporothrix hazakensis]|uniref:Uncharacterized protein n=1 Tax=Thermosporothrix hazakensis TaxID=644383 RepID=A0A326UEW9_THEHA|nr:hypothetical protein EI42_04377 [Thermosporothrix hazakensis]
MGKQSAAFADGRTMYAGHSPGKEVHSGSKRGDAAMGATTAGKRPGLRKRVLYTGIFTQEMC